MADEQNKTTKIETLADAYEALTGRPIEENNNSNLFGQLDRAFRQSTDTKLKTKIAKAFGFDQKLHGQGSRT
jgi:hypothetical protein